MQDKNYLLLAYEGLATTADALFKDLVANGINSAASGFKVL